MSLFFSCLAAFLLTALLTYFIRKKGLSPLLGIKQTKIMLFSRILAMLIFVGILYSKNAMHKDGAFIVISLFFGLTAGDLTFVWKKIRSRKGGSDD